MELQNAYAANARVISVVQELLKRLMDLWRTRHDQSSIATMYPLQTSFGQITKMQQRFAQLQMQLATGQKAGNLAEMGSDRYFDLSLRGRLGRIEGYQNNIDMVNMRLDLVINVGQGLTRCRPSPATPLRREPMAPTTQILARPKTVPGAAGTDA